MDQLRRSGAPPNLRTRFAFEDFAIVSPGDVRVTFVICAAGGATLRTEFAAPGHGGTAGWRAFLPFAGPAIVASVGYMDPGNFATNIQVGSTYGYQLLWVVLIANLAAMLFQSMSAKLGIVTRSLLRFSNRSATLNGSSRVETTRDVPLRRSRSRSGLRRRHRPPHHKARVPLEG